MVVTGYNKTLTCLTATHAHGSFLRTEEPAEGSPPEVITDMSQIHSVGTLAQVQNTIPLGMGGQVVLVSHRRIKIDGPLGVGPPLRVKVGDMR